MNSERFIFVLILLSLSIDLQARPEVGEAASDFTVKEIRSGKTLQLNDFKGQPIELIFLDSLCPMPHFPDCEAKMTALKTDIEKEPAKNRLAVFNSYYVDKAFVKAFVEKWQLGLPYVFDEDNRLFKAYGVFATPYRVLIDGDGRVLRRE